MSTEEIRRHGDDFATVDDGNLLPASAPIARIATA